MKSYLRQFDKTSLICVVLRSAGVPLCRTDILFRTYLLKHNKDVTYQPRSNNCYFSPTGWGNGGSMSVVHRGYIEKVPGTKGKNLYRLTEKGHKRAHEFWVAMGVET